jgi:hypothetical protein
VFVANVFFLISSLSESLQSWRSLAVRFPSAKLFCLPHKQQGAGKTLPAPCSLLFD